MSLSCSRVRIISLLYELKNRPLFLKDLSYANYDTICFTRFNPNANLVIRLILFFAYVGIPVFTALTISITGYLLVIRRVSRLPQSFIEGTGVSIYKLFWYPAVIFITYMPNIVMDIMKKIFVGVGDIFALKIITLVITHSFGFTNALVYGIQRKLYYGRNKDFDELENAEPILSRSGSCKSDTRELLKASQTW